MYIFDERSGAARRSYLRDKAIRALNELGWHANRRARDLGNRAWGQVAEWASAVKDSQRQMPDDVLRERVRAQLGHAVSHPGSLIIDVRDGMVHIGGDIFHGEREQIERRLAKTRGVREWRCEFNEHERGTNLPGLQGQARVSRGERQAI
jgi:hypothetical protein